MQIIYQNEVAECGYACLAMVLSHHGRDTRIKELQQLRPLSANGSRMGELYDMALEFGLAVQALQFEPDEIRRIRTGSIVHFSAAHFVVFESASSRQVTFIDPAFGRRRMPMALFGERVSGYLLEFAPTPALKKKKEKSDLLAAVRRVFLHNPALGKKLTRIIPLAVGAQFAILALPYFGNLILDKVVPAGDIGLLKTLSFTFASVFVVGILSQYFQQYFMESAYQQTLARSVEVVFAKLLRNPISYFEKRQVGDVFSRLKSQAEVVEFVSRSLFHLAMNLLVGAAALALMLAQSPLLTAVAMFIFLIYIGVACALLPRMLDNHHQLVEVSAQCDDALIETIRAAQLLKLAGQEQRRTAHFMHRMRSFADIGLRASNLANLRDAMLRAVEYTETIVIASISVLLMLKGTVSVGVFYSFLIYKTLLSDRFSGAINTAFNLLQLRIPIARVADILEEPPERYAAPAAVAVATPRHEAGTFANIQLRGVHFQYDASSPPVLENVDMDIRSGDKIALLGPSGSGKSTLFKLLTAAENCRRGSIRLNGFDYAELHVDDIRHGMAHMCQGDIILNGTMAENITLFADAPDEGRIFSLLEQVGLLDDVVALPMGLRTPVGDSIANMSAGQKQRLLIARALYQDKDLLLLDEPTSNLDRGTARRIIDLLQNSRKTIVVITHDPELAERFTGRYSIEAHTLVRH